MEELIINTKDDLIKFLTGTEEIILNKNISINKSIDMKMTQSINNTSFILNNVRFDGNKRSITNLSIKNPLFKTINKNSIVQNVRLTNMNNLFIVENNGNVTDCDLERINLNLDRQLLNINSLMIGTNNGIIENCDISDSSITNTKGQKNIMGILCGINNNIINNCSSRRCIIRTNNIAGGLVGSHFGNISNCYVEGLNNSSVYAGGFVGEMNMNSNIDSIQINSSSLNGKNNGIIFASVNNTFSSISCVKINPTLYNKHINKDIMMKYKDKIQNVSFVLSNSNDITKIIYSDNFKINNTDLCFNMGKIYKDTFNNVESFINLDNTTLYLIIFLIILIILILFLYFYKK